MPVYKDGKRGTWYTCFRYEDWTGQMKQTMKRGFRTKKEAQNYEIEFKRKASANMDMLLSEFVDIYFEDKKNELKENSKSNKHYMIDTHIIPYFGSKKMNEITAADIIQWQNLIRDKNLSPTYERMLQNQINALLNHAERIYNLKNNPCKKIKKMGKADADKMEFWTIEEYEQFISVIEKNSDNHLMAEILFWTGIREGELLALTPNDIDYEQNTLNIDKTYNRIKRKDIISSPKTNNSLRTIDIPQFLTKEIKDYISKHYDSATTNERLFPMVARTLQKRMTKYMKIAKVKIIRIHDFRHSHVSYLINQGVEPLIIKERLGHRDIRITLNIYGHLYPSQQKQVAEMLDMRRNNFKYEAIR